MKRNSFHFLLLLVFVMSTSAVPAKNLKALLSYKTFYAADTGPYIETYLSVSGKSVVYAKKENGMFQASIEVSMVYKLNNEVKHFDKYNLLSPEVKDTNSIDFNFLDQQRVKLDNGKYVFELSISDKNNTNKPFNSKQEINIEYYPNIISLSDIELVDSYKKAEVASVLSKSGYDIIPFADNYYPQDMNSLKFYAEIYNTDRVLITEPFLLSYYIQTYENKRIIEKFRGFSKQESKKVNVLLSEFPLSDLPSGNYNLVVEVRNKQNDIIAFKEVFFQRSNAKTDAATLNDLSKVDVANTFAAQFSNKDSLVDFIKSLRPISNSLEMTFENNQVKVADVAVMQRFFYDFWAKRNPGNPEKGWLDYYELVKKVNKDYSTLNKRGYETDRGRVYLQYGPPDVIQKEYREPSAYPYEVWQYYKMNNQSNRKFVFYNPDLVTNDFALIHSDAIGEPYDNQWQGKLTKRDSQNRDLDRDIKIGNFGNFGEKVNQNYTTPR